MDANANQANSNADKPEELEFMKKMQEVQKLTLNEVSVADSADDFWFHLGILSNQAGKTHELIYTTYLMQYRFDVPSRKLWIRVTDGKFRRQEPNTTYVTNELVEMLLKIKTENPARKQMLSDCLKHLVYIRLIWLVKFKTLKFTDDIIKAKLYFLMLSSMRVRVCKVDILIPLGTDKALSCILVFQQVLAQMMTLCTELLTMVACSPYFQAPQQDPDFYDGLYESEEDEEPIAEAQPGAVDTEAEGQEAARDSQNKGQDAELDFQDEGQKTALDSKAKGEEAELNSKAKGLEASLDSGVQRNEASLDSEAQGKVAALDY